MIIRHNRHRIIILILRILSYILTALRPDLFYPLRLSSKKTPRRTPLRWSLVHLIPFTPFPTLAPVLSRADSFSTLLQWA